MFSQLTELPLYQQINFLLLVGSGLLTFILCLLPTKGSGGSTAQNLTLFYIGTTVFLYASTIFSTAPKQESGTTDFFTQLYLILLPLLLYAPLIICYAVYACKHRFKPKCDHLGAVLIALGAIFACAMLLDVSGLHDFIQEQTGTPAEQSSITLLKNKPISEVIYIILSAVIVAPLIEEIFFRGFIFRIISKRTGVVLAAAISGLFFGAVHMSLMQTAALTCFGFIACILYHRTRSILYPILMHMLFNGFTIAQIYFH